MPEYITVINLVDGLRQHLLISRVVLVNIWYVYILHVRLVLV